MNFVLPSKSSVGVLDPEISGEGQKVIMSDGEQVEFSMPAPKPTVPDISTVKSLQKYFAPRARQIYPAWLYHPTEKARLVKNAAEAAELGIEYRRANENERGRYGLTWVWDWSNESQWRPQPHGHIKFDPARPENGKNVIIMPASAASEKASLVADLVPAVAAAVAQALKASGAAPKPEGVLPAQWDEFLKFQAWQKAQEAVAAVAETAAASEDDPIFEGTDDQPSLLQANALNAKPEDREALIAEAQEKGVAIDNRWGLDRLKKELAKVA